MKIEGWKYYNHAAVPTTAPHEEVDLTPINDGSIWKMDNAPLLSRWTSDFDCGYETNWWYVIKDYPFDMDLLPSKQRKHIRQALKKCYAKEIKCSEHIEELYRVYTEAQERYKNADNFLSKEEYIVKCAEPENLRYFAGYSIETDRMIG